MIWNEWCNKGSAEVLKSWKAETLCQARMKNITPPKLQQLMLAAKHRHMIVISKGDATQWKNKPFPNFSEQKTTFKRLICSLYFHFNRIDACHWIPTKFETCRINFINTWNDPGDFLKTENVTKTVVDSIFHVLDAGIEMHKGGMKIPSESQLSYHNMLFWYKNSY